eukprot:1965710-Rhodomonas_salina.1
MGVNCPVISDEDLSVMEFTCRLDLCTKACQCEVDDYLFEAGVYIGIAVAWIASFKASTTVISKQHTCPLEGEMMIIVGSKIGELNVPAVESREKCRFCSKSPDHFHDPVSSHRNSCSTDGVFPVDMLRR